MPDNLENQSELLELTADIAAAFVKNNSLRANELPALIASIHGALRAVGQPSAAAPVQEELKPAVSIKKSVTPDYIVCLEDGKKLKMLKRHLKTAYDMSPED